jgi:hypothetical protein
LGSVAGALFGKVCDRNRMGSVTVTLFGKVYDRSCLGSVAGALFGKVYDRSRLGSITGVLFGKVYDRRLWARSQAAHGNASAHRVGQKTLPINLSETFAYRRIWWDNIARGTL